jgi:osmoprotectant transport system ATP-binding protein
MIEVKNLSKHFGTVKAVDDISFEVATGENLILLGTSGCGKTTTLKMINRLIEPGSGTITVNNKDITTQHPETLRRGIGYVLQDNGLFPHYTVAENIAVVPQLLKWERGKTETRTLELIGKLSLSPDVLNKYPAQLSGGQKQRVGLARALMVNPPVLLMDEPFGALDPVTRLSIRKEFKQLDELKRKTIVMVTHDVQEAFELADRICLMDKGKIVQTGTPSELLFNPKTDFVSNFLNEQRLLLEFKSVTLTNIWPLLASPGESFKDSEHSGNADTRFNNTASIWLTLEMLTKGAKSVDVTGKNGDIKNLTIESVMSAFYQYQNNRAK